MLMPILWAGVMTMPLSRQGAGCTHMYGEWVYTVDEIILQAECTKTRYCTKCADHESITVGWEEVIANLRKVTRPPLLH